MSNDIINCVWLATAFLALFGLAELLYHYLKVPANYTRNLVHFGTGLLTFLFPVYLSSHWWVLLLCASFALILIASFKFNLLKSINAVGRVTWGSICYPIAVYGSFLVFEMNGHQTILFYLPILILAVCDPLAAIVGDRFPLGKYSIQGNSKSIGGSLAFMVTALCLSIPFFTGNHLSSTEVIGYSILVALAASVSEAASNKGLDNLSIPASVILICLWLV